jgi:hypothetical protein
MFDGGLRYAVLDTWRFLSVRYHRSDAAAQHPAVAH